MIIVFEEELFDWFLWFQSMRRIIDQKYDFSHKYVLPGGLKEIVLIFAKKFPMSSSAVSLFRKCDLDSFVIYRGNNLSAA